jgi:hypothetical protein
MNIRKVSLVLVVAILLLASCATAAKCIVYVIDEHQMTLNNADIYLNDWSHRLGTTTYNAAIGQNCWIGDIAEGEHMLYARWAGISPSRLPHKGSAAVSIIGMFPQSITIVTQKYDQNPVHVENQSSLSQLTSKQ